MNNGSVLIIGSQGYLGSRLTEYLIENDFNVMGTDTGFFKNGVIYQPYEKNILKIDARDIKGELIEKFDSVILLAGISNDPFNGFNPEDVYKPSRVYTLRIAKLCKKLGVQFIFPSSCSIYGVADGIVNENNKPNPQTFYSRNKIEIENDLEAIADNEFHPIALRLATVFGPSSRIRFDVVVNMLCGMALVNKEIILNSNGQAWRPNVHIEDVCNVFKQCLLNRKKIKGFTVLNVGKDENNIKIIDIANLIKNEINGCSISFLNKKSNVEEIFKDRKIQDGVDVRTYKVDFAKLEKTFPNLKLKWNMQNGIRNLIEFLETYLLNENKFKQREFYRLQQLEFLLSTKQLNKNLIWIKNV